MAGDEKVDPPIGGGWRLDKHIQIALIAALLLQSIAIVWWAATIDNRVTQLEGERSSLAVDRLSDRQAGARRDTSIVRLETQFIAIGNSITSLGQDVREMNAKLDRLVENDRSPARP